MWFLIAGALVLGGVPLAFVVYSLRAQGDHQQHADAEHPSVLYLKSAARRKHSALCQLPPSTLQALCGYDPTSENLSALSSFEPIQRQSQCIFARHAVLWAMADWDPVLTLEGNVARSVAAFTLFCAMEQGVDGFLFALPAGAGAGAGAGEVDADPEAETDGDGAAMVERHAALVRRLLQCLTAHDPQHSNCLQRSYAGARTWSFSFSGAELFLTTMSGAYPPSHPRFTFGVAGLSFVLVQPYSSFAHHDVNAATRAHVQARFARHGRSYAEEDAGVAVTGLDGRALPWMAAPADPAS